MLHVTIFDTRQHMPKGCSACALATVRSFIIDFGMTIEAPYLACKISARGFYVIEILGLGLLHHSNFDTMQQ